MRVYTADGMASALGMTYRQLDYWVREGYIKPTAINDGAINATPGTGKSRVWVGRDVEIAEVFTQLVAIGFKPGDIGTIAERIVRDGEATLAFGLRIGKGPVA